MIRLHSSRATALMLAACCGLARADVPAEPAGRRPRTALLLSGGGARGAAHLGVLRVLEELRVPVDFVVGTSMGAVVGGLYASGVSPERLETELLGVDWRDLFTDRPPRQEISFRRKQDDNQALFRFELGVGRSGFVLPAGLIAGQKLGRLLRNLTLHVTGVRSFDDFPIPFRAVAADLATGEAVVLGGGDLADAIRASMAIPGVFAPKRLDGRTLVDGGIVQNLPVEVARALGAERIIAVDVSTPPKDIPAGSSAVGVALQTIFVLTDRNVQEQRALLGPQDVFVQPRLGTIQLGDFEKLPLAIELGAAGAREHAAELAALGVSEEDFAAYLRRRASGTADPFGDVRLARVDVEGVSRVDPRLITRRIETRAGRPFDVSTLQADLERVQQIGEFQQVDFHLERGGALGDRLVIGAQEKSWGPNYLRFGLALEADFRGQGDFTVLADFTRTQLNRYGAEWKSLARVGNVDSIETELYQPLGYAGFGFVSPQVEAERAQRDVLQDDGTLFNDDQTLLRGRFDLGVQFRNYGELRIGAERGSIESELAAAAGAAGGRIELGGARLLLTYDQIDNANFPRHGAFAQAELLLSRAHLGADEEYDKLALAFVQAGSLGRNTLIGQLRYGTSLSNTDLPFYDRFRLGGFLNLSGLRPGQLQGDTLAYLQLSYYNRVARLPGALGGGIYLGGAVEAGNIWADSAEAELGELRPALLIFGGMDTVLGPVYLGHGRADNGDNSFYLFLGRPF